MSRLTSVTLLYNDGGKFQLFIDGVDVSHVVQSVEIKAEAGNPVPKTTIVMNAEMMTVVINDITAKDIEVKSKEGK